MPYVKLTGSSNRHENWTTEYILERDDETREVTKSVRQGEPVDITKEQQEKLESLGAVFESSTKAEAEEFQKQQASAPQVGADVAAAAPLLGDTSTTAVRPAPTPAPAPAAGSDNDNS